MNLLFICHELPPIGGGSGNAALALARELAVEHSVVLLTSGYRELPAQERHGQLRVLRLPSPRRRVDGASPIELVAFAALAVREASRLHRERPFDAAVAVHATAAAWAAWLLRKRRGIPYVLALRGADVPGFFPEMYGWMHRASSWLTRRCWGSAAALVANSEGLKRLAERTAAPLGRAVKLIENGVDADFFTPAASMPQGQGLFVGRLSRQKGLEPFFEALRLGAPRLRGRLRLEIVGVGELASTLSRLAEDGLADIVSFSPWMDKEALRERYRASSFFVFPSLEEGMSNALLEAMACGLPVLAADVYGNKGLVENGVNGFLIPPDDPAAWAEALYRMAALEPTALKSMGQKSRQKALGKSWGEAARRYESLLPHPAAWTPERVARFFDLYQAQGGLEDNYFGRQRGAALLRFVLRRSLLPQPALDVGCGPGYFLEYLVAARIRCAGADLSAASVERANRRLGGNPYFLGAHRMGDGFALPFEDGAFQSAFLMETAEHLLPESIAAVFGELRRVLAPGGRLVVTTPYREDLRDSSLLCPHCGATFHQIQHVSSFDERNLPELLESHGFSCELAEAPALLPDWRIWLRAQGGLGASAAACPECGKAFAPPAPGLLKRARMLLRELRHLVCVAHRAPGK